MALAMNKEQKCAQSHEVEHDHVCEDEKDHEDEEDDEPEEALVVEEVAAGVTPHALRVPLLVKHCQEEPGIMKVLKYESIIA